MYAAENTRFEYLGFPQILELEDALVMNTANRRLVPLYAALSISAFAISAGCEYDSPFVEDRPSQEEQSGMSTFYKDTGGDNQDPVLSGGQAPFCR